MMVILNPYRKIRGPKYVTNYVRVIDVEKPRQLCHGVTYVMLFTFGDQKDKDKNKSNMTPLCGTQ